MPRVDCFLLADAAQALAGKLYVLGGGWDRLVFTHFPAVVTFDIAVRVVIPWTETNRPLRFELHLENEDGQRLLNAPALTEISIGRPPELREGSEQTVPLVVKLAGTPIPRPGRYVFTMRHDGEEVARTAFEAARVVHG